MSKTETSKRKGRAPAKLCIDKPGMGKTYVVKSKNDKGKTIYVRIATGGSRDNNPKHRDNPLQCSLTNYTNGDPVHHEKYFLCKFGKKGSMVYSIFLCSDHHKKCMGFEINPKLDSKDYPQDISRVMKSASKEFDTVEIDGKPRVVITGYVENLLEYEWTGMSYDEAKEKGLTIFALNANGVLEEDDYAGRTEKKTSVKQEEKPAAKTEEKTEKPAAKKATAKKSAAKKKPAAKTAKESGAAKKPAKKKKTYFGVKDGKVVIRRTTADLPEGFFMTRDEANDALTADDEPQIIESLQAEQDAIDEKNATAAE